MASPENKKRKLKRASEYTELRFPDDLGPYHIVLNFSKYERNSVGVIDGKTSKKSIALPIPTNLQDSFSIKTGMEEMSIGVVSDKIATSVQNAETQSALEDVMKGVEGIKDVGIRALLRQGLSSIPGPTEDLYRGSEIALGRTLNPHLAMSFDGIDMKNHQFEWNLAPQSPSESEKLKEIVSQIKYEITPNYAFEKNFLEYPSVVDIHFQVPYQEHLYKFKRCMVSSFDVNYAGGGTPAFLRDGKPASVNLSMSLTEMEIWTKEDLESEDA